MSVTVLSLCLLQRRYPDDFFHGTTGIELFFFSLAKDHLTLTCLSHDSSHFLYPVAFEMELPLKVL